MLEMVLIVGSGDGISRRIRSSSGVSSH